MHVYLFHIIAHLRIIKNPPRSQSWEAPVLSLELGFVLNIVFEIQIIWPMSSLTCEHSCLDDLGGSRLEIPMHTQFLCGRLGHSINVGVRRIKKESWQKIRGNAMWQIVCVLSDWGKIAKIILSLLSLQGKAARQPGTLIPFFVNTGRGLGFGAKFPLASF